MTFASVSTVSAARVRGLTRPARYPRMVSATSPSPADHAEGRRVALLTLGCARNEVDSEELAARLHADGWQVTTDGEGADVVVVNTCGFVEKAKQDSIQTLLAAAGTGAKVVAAGCMAERYGRELADSLPEAQAVLSFDDYPDIAARLNAVVAGEQITAHTPRDRRELLPLTPVQRRDSTVSLPGHGTVTRTVVDTDEHTPAHLRQVLRRRLDTGPVASLKLASGCDRRCAFCAIPAFRGPSSRVRRTNCSPRRSGWPRPAYGSWCWSARTPPRTARTWVTRAPWRSCCRSSPR